MKADVSLYDLYRKTSDEFRYNHIPRVYGRNLYSCCDEIMQQAIKIKYGVDLYKVYELNIQDEKRLNYTDYWEILDTIHEINKEASSLIPMKITHVSHLETLMNDLIDGKID